VFVILEVQHETRLEYSEPVSEWVTEVRMEPSSDAEQTCHSFHLVLSQPASPFRFQDGFGNRVHHFNLLTPLQEVRILAASIVETHPRPANPPANPAVYPLALTDMPLSVLEYLRLRGAVSATPLLRPLLETLRPEAGCPLDEWAARVRDFIRSHFEYAKEVTDAGSNIADLLQQGKGVCQDFAHLMIAVLRSFGVPARYVSGYLHRPNKESESHAWCEFWLPERGWVGQDPTNGCPAEERFVKVAVGRDFGDVPPNKGVFRGRSEETIFVRVESRALERLPSLSWREELPALNVPLTAIRRTPCRPAERQEEMQQQ
jgi:transglutaminase-like putative cysteine protease